ncbi:polysaccharide biosynthesis/export family protein [Salinibius halmophilus]|uniref:polysaccharide biosynthesis/export family protein n=1 Tax=Salinibius halmophilus TaxID=1853216 RepID=UPI000E6657E5|nr:polysaccharide biosynthesis/export family protein [Salinibius halmophilus]
MIRLICIVLSLVISGLALAEGQTDYRLAAGDEISIQVFGQDDLSLELSLGESGVINYPFLGEIQIAGRTTREIEQEITAGLKGDYLIDPAVQVQIIAYRPFFIFGEVKRPGSYPYQPGLTITQAVALAGGFTERASNNAITVYPKDSAEALESAPLNRPVAPGDTIDVGRRFF